MKVNLEFFKQHIVSLANIIEEAGLDLSQVKFALPQDAKAFLIIDGTEADLEKIREKIETFSHLNRYEFKSLTMITKAEVNLFGDRLKSARTLFSSDFLIKRKQPKESLESLEPLVKGYQAGATRYNLYQTIATFTTHSSPTTTVTCGNKQNFDATIKALETYTKLAIQCWTGLLLDLSSIANDYLSFMPPNCFFQIDNTLAASSISHIEIYADEKGENPFCLAYSRPVNNRFSVAPLLDEFEGIFHIKNAPPNLAEENTFFEEKTVVRLNAARFSLKQFLEGIQNEAKEPEYFTVSSRIVDTLLASSFVPEKPAKLKAAFASALRATAAILRTPAVTGNPSAAMNVGIQLEMASIQVGKCLSYNATAFAFCFEQDKTEENQPTSKDVLALAKLISDKPKPSLSYHFMQGWTKLSNHLQITFLKEIIPFLIKNKASLHLEDYPGDFKKFVTLLKEHSETTPDLIKMITVNVNKHHSKFPTGKPFKNRDEAMYIALLGRASDRKSATTKHYDPRKFRKPPSKLNGAAVATTAPALIVAQAAHSGKPQQRK